MLVRDEITNNNVIVNLLSVTNIRLIEVKRKNIFRIVFNLDYMVDLFGTPQSDFVYWDYDSEEEAKEVFNHLLVKVCLTDTWIQYHGVLVNLSLVSSIVDDENNKRIIFNFKGAKKLGDKITSDFVYFDFDTSIELLEYKTVELFPKIQVLS